METVLLVINLTDLWVFSCVHFKESWKHQWGYTWVCFYLKDTNITIKKKLFGNSDHQDKTICLVEKCVYVFVTDTA